MAARRQLVAFLFLAAWASAVPLRAQGTGEPWLTFRAGTVLFDHPRAEARPSGQFTFLADNSTAFDTARLDPGTAGGLDIYFAQQLATSLDIELRYFGINDWHAANTVSDPGQIEYHGFGTTLVSDTARVDYGAQLYNFEANLRWRLYEWLPIVGGFRMLQLHEQFQWTDLAGGAAESRILGRTNNYLHGVQLGIEPGLATMGWLRVDGVLKAGAFWNNSRAQTLFPAVDAGFDRLGARSAYAAEVGLFGSARIMPHVYVRGGYELLWLLDVAMAPDQSRAVSLYDGTAALNNTSTALFHGAVINLELSF